MIVQMDTALTIFQKALVMTALVLTFATTYLILRSSEYIDKALGVTGIMVLTRIQGLVLGAIAVNFVAMGAWNIFVSLKSVSP